jgi:hypothetical protein
MGPWGDRPGRTDLRQIAVADAPRPLLPGVHYYNGEEFPGRHEPLVTAELFAKVQAVLDERLPKRARGSGGITTT